MKLRATKDVSYVSRSGNSPASPAEIWVAEGDTIELNLDDFEVVDGEGLEFVGIRGELYKVAVDCDHRIIGEPSTMCLGVCQVCGFKLEKPKLTDEIMKSNAEKGYEPQLPEKLEVPSNFGHAGNIIIHWHEEMWQWMQQVTDIMNDYLEKREE